MSTVSKQSIVLFGKMKFYSKNQRFKQVVFFLCAMKLMLILTLSHSNLALADSAIEVSPLTKLRVPASTLHFVNDPSIFLDHDHLPNRYNVLALTAGDIDKDGLTDIVAILDNLDVGSGNPKEIVIAVARNRTPDIYSPLEFALSDVEYVATNANYSASASKLVDIDNDGDLELLFTLPSVSDDGDDQLYETEFYVSRANTDERITILQPSNSQPVPFRKAFDFIAKDFNYDGLIDIFTLYPNFNTRTNQQELFRTIWQDPKDMFRVVGVPTFDHLYDASAYRLSSIFDPTTEATDNRKSAIAWNGGTNQNGNHLNGTWGVLLSGGLYSSFPQPTTAANWPNAIQQGNRFGLQFDVNSDGLYEFIGDKHTLNIEPLDSISTSNTAIFDYSYANASLINVSGCDNRLFAIFDVDANGAVDYLYRCTNYLSETYAVVVFMHTDGTVKRAAHVNHLLNGNPVPYADNNQSPYLLVRDFNNDGNLDVASINSSSKDELGQLWTARNINPSNMAPTTPTTLTHEFLPTAFDKYTRLSWDPGIDDTTSTSNLMYNVKLHRHNPAKPTDPYIVMSALASESGEDTYLPHEPNIGFANHVDLKNLPVGEYTWSVQTLDSSFHASPFAPLQTMTVSRPDADYSVKINTVDSRELDATATVEITITYESLSRPSPRNRQIVVVNYRKPVDMDILSASGRGDFNKTTGDWTISGLLVPEGSSSSLSNELTLTIELGNYELGSRLEHWAEVVSTTNDDPDSTPSNGFNGDHEDDFAYENLGTYTGFADLTLTSQASEQQNAAGETEFVVELTLSNNGANLPAPIDLSALKIAKRVVVKVDDSTLLPYGLARCSGVSVPNNFNAMHKLWLEKDIAVGENRTLTLKYCSKQGQNFPATGTILEHYAEIISARERPVNPNNTYDNHSTTETDDAPTSHVVVNAPITLIDSGSYIREFCWRIRTSNAICYTVSLYRVTNLSDKTITELPLAIETTGDPNKIYYSYDSQRQFNRSTKQWSLKNISARKTVILYTVSMRYDSGITQGQKLLMQTTGYKHARAKDKPVLSSQVLEEHSWVNNQRMTYFNWR